MESQEIGESSNTSQNQVTSTNRHTGTPAKEETADVTLCQGDIEVNREEKKGS